MGDADDLLPSFTKPPISEVALVVQFKKLRAMRNLDFIRLWTQSEYKTDYPSVGEYVPLPEFYEIFGSGETTYSPRYGYARPIARYNFRSEERKEQIQIQRDRIAFYWQRGDDNTYPRFPYILERFRRDYDILNTFAMEKGWGELVPNQCMVTYNNRLMKGAEWQHPNDFHEVVNFWSRPHLDPELSEGVEGAAALFRVKIDGPNGPAARMYVSFETKEVEQEPREAAELELAVRGPVETADLSGACKFFEMARRHIVRTFASVTTPKMHKLWGKQ